MGKTGKRQGGGERPSGDGDGAGVGLSAAADALEAEMRNFDRLTALAVRIELDSHKNLDAAADAVQQAAESHTRFGTQLGALIEAVAVARDRQQASATALNERAVQINQRRAGFEMLRERFGALGEEVRAINALAIDAAAAKSGGNATPEDVATTLDAAIVRMEAIVESARALGSDAREQGMVDLDRQADALRQKILAARNKLHQLREAIGGAPPAAKS